MRPTRSLAAALVIGVGAVVMVAAGVAYWFLTAVPVHSDASAVPAAVGVRADRFAAAAPDRVIASVIRRRSRSASEA
jgi:hypothetical protein